MSARILVVDDEEIVIRSCLRILGESGYEVEAVQSGADALRKVEESRYDVMILDIMMPKMDGMEVLQRVKETHGYRRHHDHRTVPDRDRSEGHETRGLRLPAEALRS